VRKDKEQKRLYRRQNKQESEQQRLDRSSIRCAGGKAVADEAGK
jgi:hypothetical protein